MYAFHVEHYKGIQYISSIKKIQPKKYIET